MLHAAGHSPGHLAFHWPERSFLIAGDAVATWPELCPGWTSFNLNMEAAPRVARSGWPTLEAEIVGVGHGDPITQGAADKVHDLADRPAP